jgi:hypothetical protein
MFVHKLTFSCVENQIEVELIIEHVVEEIASFPIELDDLLNEEI